VLLGLTRIEADTDYVRFFRADTRVPRDYAALAEAGFPQNPLDLVLRLPPGGGSLSRHWREVQHFAERLETVPGVHSVLSPFSLASTAEEAGAIGNALGMLSPSGDLVQLTVMTRYPSSRELLANLERISALADASLPPRIGFTPTGTSLLWARMDAGVIRTQRQSLAVVCIVCFVVLALLFRSLRLAVVGLLVSILPVAMVLGVMGLTGIPLNMATVLIAGIAVGLAVDDTVHFVHAWQSHRTQGVEAPAACEAAMAEVGPRLVMTSAILVGSFGAMAASAFMPTAHFGLLSSLTILLALVADITVLPIVLASLDSDPVPLPSPRPVLRSAS
jgi:uncharacterized protein